MKKIFYFIVFSLMSVAALEAQTDGLWLISQKRIGSTTRQTVVSPMAVSPAPISVAVAPETGGYCSYSFVGKSRYSSNITAIGSLEPVSSTGRGISKRREGEWEDDDIGENKPTGPFEDPVGEVPFVLMALLAAAYAAYTTRAARHRARHA